ncbi:type III pantothenate kinase [Pseudothauera rhizosphaerae]|uniref:Type III pantothenate kinase n=1 Tax=Pseudothauera rhizosphaerae TaxID=2565932 RepID=A0A4S4ANN5_9RHOO|nr:type III pantothenate kinase [Pseudothauera rhizosphaerae]THF61254.1 type III pantothenate kinase [Pseudothauera rhizosphaerae]
MMLLIDAGNTRIKWAVAEPGAAPGDWLAHGSFAHDDGAALPAVLAAHPGIRRVLGSNVAGPALGVALDATLAAVGLRAEWLASTAERAGVRNGYGEPGQLGTDRWAALIGARRLHRGPCLVVSAGTATTADVLDADGLFRGGVILPGVGLMLRALARNTAQLPFADGHFSDVPRNTADAIVTGCLHAQAGAVERMFRPLAEQPGALCLLTGGAAGRFADLLQVPLRRVDNLVLIGLATVAGEGPQPAAMG